MSPVGATGGLCQLPAARHPGGTGVGPAPAQTIEECGSSVTREGSRVTMGKKDIISAVMLRVENSYAPKYSVWYIGVTNDPLSRKAWHDAAGEDTTFMQCWEASSLADAREAEFNLVNEKGMNGITTDEPSSGKPVFVYIF